MIFWLLLMLMQDRSPETEKPDMPATEAVENVDEAGTASPEYNQTEYPIAWALTAAMLLLGMLAVCIPRFRKQHFVEPPGPAGRKSVKRR